MPTDPYALPPVPLTTWTGKSYHEYGIAVDLDYDPPRYRMAPNLPGETRVWAVAPDAQGQASFAEVRPRVCSWCGSRACFEGRDVCPDALAP
jgi:hypothetical protein